jgi:hypothetical protein
MADNIVGTKIVIDSSQAVESVGSIKKQLRDATNDLVSLAAKFGEGSQEAVNAAKRVAELRDRIGDAKSMADAFNPDAKFKAFSQSLQGVAGGFAAVQGAMAVFGVESEDLQKTLVKVQGALALSEGLNTFLDTGIQGFKNLISVIQNSTVVIKANEIATKAAALTMKLFGVEVETTSVAFNVLKGAMAATGIGLLVVALGQAVTAFDKLSDAAQEAADKQKAFNKTIKDGAKFELDELLKSLDNQMRIDVSKAKARGASEQEIFNIEQSYRRRKTEAQIRYYNEIKKIDTQAAKDASNDIAKSNADGIVARNERIAADRKEREEKAKKDKEKRDEELKKEKEHQEAKDKLFEDFKLLNKKRDEDQLVEFDNQLKEETQLNKEAKEQQAKDDAFLSTERLKAEIQVVKFREELIKKEKEARLEALTAVASSLDRASQLAEEGSAAQKALAISSAIISAILSAQKAYESTIGIPIVGPVLAPINAGISLAAGYKSVQKIMSVQTPGGNTGGVSMPSGSFGSGAPVSPAPMQNTVTQLNQGTINALGNQAIKAYVLESDVTNSQGRVTRILNSSRFK